MLAGQVDEVAAGPEREVGVVGAHHLTPARDDDRLAGERGGDGGSALGIVGRLRPLARRQLEVAPTGAHELHELLRISRVVRLGAVRLLVFRLIFRYHGVSSGVLHNSLTWG